MDKFLVTHDNNGFSRGTRSRPRAAWRTALIAGLPLVVLAVFIAWTARQAFVAHDLLGALAQARAGVRSVYGSAVGYGPDGFTPNLTWTRGVAWPEGTADNGSGVLSFKGGERLTVVSRVRDFEVTLSGVSPMACQMLVRSLDEGWREVRLDGRVVEGAPRGPLPWTVCGVWRPVTLSLISAG